jgi:hypothetical protein
MNPPGPRHFVSVSPAVRERLRQESVAAATDGRLAPFLTALRVATQRLEDDPTVFGEELYDLPALQLTVRIGVILPLAVEFAPHATQPIVFVRSFRYVVPG